MASLARASGILRRRSSGHAAQMRTMANATVQLPELPYDYSALEPVIDREIMEIHHKKHHQTYVTNYNKALGDYHQADEAGDVKKLVTLQSAINFNGGGHINHSIFWKNLTPEKEYQDPEGELKSAIESNFGSLDAFKVNFNKEATGVQGSGWGWLGYNPTNGALEIATTPNQDILDKQTGLVPLLGIDVWEHAYYLQYKNARPEYLKNIWKVVNWEDVAERYAAAKK